MTSDQILTIKSLLSRFGCTDFAAILKWDESKVTRNPKGKGGGRFARSTGGASAMGMTALGLKERNAEDLPRNSVAAYQRHVLDQSQAEAMARIQEEAAEFHGSPRMAGGLTLPAPEHTVTEALATGTASAVVRALSGSANSCYIIEMEDGTKGFYKPQNGETWEASFNNYDINTYITDQDNKAFSLAEREAFASEASVALGLGRLVPETHHRPDLDVPGTSSGGGGGGSDSGGYDTDMVRDLYDEYEAKARSEAQNDAYDDISDEMSRLYNEAQDEHVQRIQNRADEMAEIWNEEVKAFPDNNRYGSDTFLTREHPVLPLGDATEGRFERKEKSKEIVDPLEVLKEADVVIDEGFLEAPQPYVEQQRRYLNDEERENVRKVIREKLEAGALELGDVDEAEAKEDLEYDDWRELHEGTEIDLLDQAVKDRIESFDEWRHNNGYYSNSGGGMSVQSSSDNPGSGGALMEFLEGASDYGTLKHEDATKFAVLDYVIGTMDRHGRNVIYDKDGKPRAIDNGYSMPGGMDTPDDFQFRSIAVGTFMNSARADSVPESLRSSIRGAMDATDWNAFAERHPNMSRDEREAFLGRVERMKEALKTPEGLHSLWSGLQLQDY